MGCFGSKDESGDSAKEGPTGSSRRGAAARTRDGAARAKQPAVRMSWDRPQHPTNLTCEARRSTRGAAVEQSRDPADYRAEGLRDATFVRLPGEINDQRINVDGCQNCVFALLDQCDSVQIDDCVNCKFFIGPTMSSVFVRNTKDCTFVVACGQLRTRDVKRCNFSLYCQSRPCIEASTQIGIGCFHTAGYFELGQHFAKARLSTFANLYSMVHDFTPREGNYHLLDAAAVRAEPPFPPLHAHVEEFITAEESAALSETPVVPYTHGAREHHLPRVRLLLFAPGCCDEAERLTQLIDTTFSHAVDAGNAEPDVLLLHTSELKYSNACISAIAAATAAASAPELSSSAAKALQGCPAVAVAFAYRVSDDAKRITDDWRARVGADDAERAVLYEHDTAANAAARALLETFFQKLPLEGMGFGASH